MRLFLLVILGSLIYAARTFSPMPGLGSAPAFVTLAFGYLLLSAFIAGSLFKGMGLPRLTGYLALGIVAGPEALGLLSQGSVESLRIVNGVAVALIALTAGTEMHFRSMRPLVRTVAWITVVAVLGTTLLLAVAVFFGRRFLPFVAELPFLQAVAVSLVLGVTMVAQSPAVVVALRDEMDAEGPVSATVLTVVVLADLVVIVLFAVVSSLAKASFGEAADVAHTAKLIAWGTLGSGVAGLVVGGLLALYHRYVKGGAPLFVVTVCFVVAEIGDRLDLDPLLVALAAGMFVRNATDVGEMLHREIEAASLPVYVAFFAVAGATIHLDALAIVGLPALALVGVRALGLLTGTRIATAIAGAPPTVRSYAGFGLLPQAGLALALAILFVRAFPDFGAPASALVFAVVAINEVVAPIAYRAALVRSGEAGLRRPSSVPADLGEAPTEVPD